MKIVLDLALSADGFIARPDGDSSWVSERTEEFFKNRIHELGCLVVGKTTFQQYAGAIYPVKGVLNLVLTKNAQEQSDNEHVVYAPSPEEAIRIARERNCKGVLIAGGSIVSRTFLEKNLIDEIYFSKHPLRLGEGIKPFGDMEIPKNLTPLGSIDLGGGVIKEHYRVDK